MFAKGLNDNFNFFMTRYSLIVLKLKVLFPSQSINLSVKGLLVCTEVYHREIESQRCCLQTEEDVADCVL